jgi:hypothetical protein
MNSKAIVNAATMTVLNTELAKSLFLSSSTRVEAFLSPKRQTMAFPICDLPSVLLVSIIRFLDIPDFFRLVCTCRRLAGFRRDEALWRFLCLKRWAELRLPLVKSLPVYSSSSSSVLRSSSSSAVSASSVSVSVSVPASSGLDWKELARCFMVQVNLLSDKSKFTGEGFSRTSTDLYFGRWERGQCEGFGFRLYFQVDSAATNNAEGAAAAAGAGEGEEDLSEEEEEGAQGVGESSSEEARHGNGGRQKKRREPAPIKYDVYEGHWSRDLPDGFGSKKWSNGDSYSGYWKQGYTHGHGVYTWGIGDKYDGNYDEGKRNGEGTYFYADGSTYVGSWLNHKQHGFGKRKYLNGNSYEGEWCEGNLEGKGTFIWHDNSDYHGDVYIGNWRDNSEHGQGEYRSVFGTVYSGIYNMGTRQGNGGFAHADGYSWVGGWHNDIPQDLDLALHPKMREVLDSGKCTESLTKKTPFYGQVLFRCLDCHGLEDTEKRRYVCQNCIEVCHKTHRIEKKIWTCGRSFCWCENCTLRGDKAESNESSGHEHTGSGCNCK